MKIADLQEHNASYELCCELVDLLFSRRILIFMGFLRFVGKENGIFLDP